MSIAPNPADLPSPANRYRLPERVHATSDLFNLVFGSIGARLDAAEGKSADYDAAIDRIIGQALQTVSAALTIEIAAGRAEFEAVREAFEELQSGGFSAARIAATLNGHPTVTHVQGALTTLLGLVRDLDALLPDVGEADGLKFLRAKADRSGFELAEVDLYSAALMRRVSRPSNTQIVKADKGKLFVVTGSFTQTVASPADLGDGHHYFYKNAGTGNITIPASDGRTNWIMYPGEMRLFQCDGATLRSEVLSPFFATFTASGNFILPPGYVELDVEMWGAGGGGGWNGSVSGGGGGGYYLPFNVRASALAASNPIAVGAGGAAGLGGAAGQAGGNTSFAGFTAFGGGGGYTNRGGGGGGLLSAGSQGEQGPEGAGGQGLSQLTFGANGGVNASGNSAFAYGGGGGAGGTINQTAGAVGGNSLYGGGGGGSRTTSDGVSPAAGGRSFFGGNGGAAGEAGFAPGGGGGGTRLTSNGDPKPGARGEIRIRGIA